MHAQLTMWYSNDENKHDGSHISAAVDLNLLYTYGLKSL